MDRCRREIWSLSDRRGSQSPWHGTYSRQFTTDAQRNGSFCFSIGADDETLRSADPAGGAERCTEFAGMLQPSSEEAPERCGQLTQYWVHKRGSRLPNQVSAGN